jgi:class 3 adenylate cyclase/tetratricopeptide (TPR) repeat protein
MIAADRRATSAAAWGAMPHKVFISYRRGDAAGYAGRVSDRLSDELGQDALFMDVDAIPLGSDFVKVLREEVGRCQVLLALIGPSWLGALDGQGKRRLDDPDDFVRIEIATALIRDIPVIPVLFDGVAMPAADSLPDNLKELRHRNALNVRHEAFHADLDKLVGALRNAFDGVEGSPNPPARDAVRSVAEPTPPSAPVSEPLERRHLTILSGEAVSPSAPERRLDPEDQQESRLCFQARCRGDIEALGGVVADFPGDGVVAYFGVPTAHEDDAERAVRAGLAILDRGEASPFGPMPRVRLGIASGMVVLADAQVGAMHRKTAIGDAATLATHLRRMAEPDAIVIAPETHRLVGDLFEYKDLGLQSLPDFAESPHLRQVLGASAAGKRFSTLGPRQGPMIGRQFELEQLRATLGPCANGRGCAVYIRGEAGIGKTRLLEAFLGEAEGKGFGRHRALILEFGAGAGRDAVRALARDICGVGPKDGPETARAAADAVLAEGLCEAEDAAFLYDLLDAPQPTEMRALYDAMDNAARNGGKRRTLAHLIGTASRRQPRVLAIEDLHWADPATLTQLAAIAAMVADTATLLVMTSRQETDPLDRAWRAQAGRAPFVTIDLGPLPSEEATTLATSILGADAGLIKACVERAAGNPLFLEQILCNAAEDSAAAVPVAVTSIVQARLDRLDEQDKRGLQAASVLGQRFDPAALGGLLDGRADMADRLLATMMVQPQNEELAFSHALICEAIYESMPKARRRDLHRRAAQWFAARDLALRAEHLDRAQDPAAPGAFLEAAKFEAARYRYEVAERLVERGLATASEHSERFNLAAFHGDILHDLGEMPRALEAFETALGAASDDIERCRAWIGVAQVKRVTEDLDGALAMLDLAEAVTVREHLTAEEARLRFLRGNLLFPRGDIDGCFREHARSLDLAREAGAGEQEAAALGGLGDAEYVRGRMMSAERRLRECVELSRQQGFGRIEVANHSQLAHAMLYVHPLAEALEVAAAAEARAARIGHLRAQCNASAVATAALPILGDWDALEGAIAHSRALVERLGARRYEQFNASAAGSLFLGRGQAAEAVESLRRAVISAEETGLAFNGASIHGRLARALTDPGERQRELAIGEDIIMRGCVGHNQLHFYPQAIEVALELGDWDEADRYAAALERFARPEPLPWSSFFARRGHVLAAMGRGRPGHAGDITELLEQAETSGYVVAQPALRAALASAREQA